MTERVAMLKADPDLGAKIKTYIHLLHKSKGNYADL